MEKCRRMVVVCLLLFIGSIHALASEEFESPGGKVVEVKSHGELASLAGGLNWSGNNTIYVMVPTLSQDNSTSPINESTYPQTDALTSLKQSVRDIQGKNLTAEEPLNESSLTGTIVALRSNMNNKYVHVRHEESAMGAVDYFIEATSDIVGDCEKFQLIDLGNNQVAIKCCNGYYFHVYRPFGIRTEKIDCWPPDDFGNLDSEYEFKKTGDGNGGWSFQASNGKYLCVDNGDRIKASRDKIGPWEIFRIELITEPKLQDQINAASPGGTVTLKEGIYKGPVTIDKSVNLVGVGSGKTVVEMDNKDTVFTIGGDNPDIDVSLKGILIRGGLNEHGGGIYNYGRLTIEDTIITRNTATYSGGGIYVYNGSLRIKNSRICGNRAAHQGGGIINFNGTVNMESGIIDANTAAYGGGVLNHGLMNMYMGSIINNIALGLSSTSPEGEGAGVWNDRIFNFRGGNVQNNQPDNVYYRGT